MSEKSRQDRRIAALAEYGIEATAGFLWTDISMNATNTEKLIRLLKRASELMNA